MHQQIQPYPQQQQQDALGSSLSRQDTLEVSPVIVPSMSPVTDFPLYYYYYLQPQGVPRPMVR